MKYICMSGDYAFVGDTPEQAYQNMLESDCDYELFIPTNLVWFAANQVDMKLIASPIKDEKAKK